MHLTEPFARKLDQTNTMTDFLASIRRIIHPERTSDSVAKDDHAIPRAAAVLLIELAMADDAEHASERAIIEAAMAETFGLESGKLEALLKEAETIQNQATSMHEYTQQLRADLSASERAELIEWLWRVAYADQKIDPYEEQLIRRLADLIGVPHREMIRRKHRAEHTEADDG